MTCKRRLRDFNTIHSKYVDDQNVAEAINMKEQLTEVPTRHLPYQEKLKSMLKRII